MNYAVTSVWAGLALAAAALWMVGPLWSLVPAALLVAFGLRFDVGGNE